MKILIASDSHKDTTALENLYKNYPNMDLYLFAGDSCDCASNLYPFDSVKGNCDFYEFDEKRFIRTKIGNIFMRHYPYITEDESKDVNFFIHGHTHVYKIKRENNLITICPGAISFSRDSSGGSYAIIDEHDSIIEIKILSIETKKVLIKETYNLK